MSARGAGGLGVATRPRARRTVAVLAGGNLTYAASQTMVLPALPNIGSSFSAGPGAVGWVMSGFFISSAIFTGIIGRLGDMFGKRRLLLATMAAYAIGCLVAAAAPNLLTLVIGRVVMGSGGGMVPLAYSIARDEVAPERVSRALGTIAMTLGLGAGIGMVLGGVLVDHLGWRWGFLLAGSLMTACLVLAARSLAESPIRSPAPMDWVGAALLSSGLGVLLFAVSRAEASGVLHPGVVALAVLGSSALVALVVVERRRPHPLLDVTLLARRPVLVTNITSLVNGAGQIGVVVLTVQLAQVPRAAGGPGASPSSAGLHVLPYSVCMVLGALLAGHLAGRHDGRRVLIVGSAVAGCGLLGLALSPADRPYLLLFPAIGGLGISATLVAAPYLLAQFVDRSHTGEANGVNAIFRAVGQSFGSQIAASILAANVVVGGTAATADGFAKAFAFGASLCGLAFVTCFALPRLGPRVGTGDRTSPPPGRSLAGHVADDLVSPVVPAAQDR